MSRAVLTCTRDMGVDVPDEGDVGVVFDDSIVQDAEAEKARDMREVVAGLMLPWEYRMRWYGEDEATARRNVREVAGAVGAAAAD